MFQNMFLKSINYGAIKYMKQSHFPETLKRQRQCIDKVVNSPRHISPCLYLWCFWSCLYKQRNNRPSYFFLTSSTLSF